MAQTPFALQVHSVRDDAVQDMMGTLERIASMGYAGVEFAGFHGHEAGSLREKLDQLGLACVGSHTRIDWLQDDQFESTVDFHRELGCDSLIVPALPEHRRQNREACLETAREFTDLNDRLRPRGMTTGFHCHATDVRPLEGETTPWDLLADHTPAEFVLQYDTANGMAGGADPVGPIRRRPGRSRTVHLKAYAGGHGQVAIGEPGDQVPWDEVFQACKTEGGTQWYIVEQEGHPDLSPLDAADRCFTNLRKMGW